MTIPIGKKISNKNPEQEIGKHCSVVKIYVNPAGISNLEAGLLNVMEYYSISSSGTDYSDSVIYVLNSGWEMLEVMTPDGRKVSLYEEVQKVFGQFKIVEKVC